ncbi:MAG: hypothetical protein ACAH59_10285 [Pseudobdellovibrionaceae bacterium]
MIRFTTFLGIDQTGATDHKGLPKPLPVALITRTSSGWQLTFSQKGRRLEMPSLHQESLLRILHDFPHPGRDLSRTALILDSVFGLPASQWPPQAQNLFTLFQRASQFSYQGKEFGREAAEKFFAQFLKNKKPSGKLPQRICEIKTGANSIFLTKPFQRNIGCGTYRIWKELGSAREKWFQIWGFDEPLPHLQDGPWIFEAYPSFFWKKILGFAKRNPQDLLRYLKTEAIHLDLQIEPRSLNLLLEDPDLCDSVVLALSALILQEKNFEIWHLPQIPELQKEGWILGL